MSLWADGRMMLAREARRSRRTARRGGRLRPTLPIALLASLAFGMGCQTMRSFEHGCPGIYSGVRYYNEQVGSLPLDGKVFFTVDLPLTAIGDTLLLPVTGFSDPPTPVGGFPIGCRWAHRSRR